MSLAVAPPGDQELLRSLWMRLFQLKRWPSEYRMFFLAAATRLVEREGVTRAISLLGRPRGLLSLGRGYATTPTDSSQGWLLARVWLDRLGPSAPALEALTEPVRAMSAPMSLADCRRRYGNHWDAAVTTLAEDFLLSPWAMRYPDPMTAVLVLHLEATLLRVLLSVHPAAEGGQPARAVDEVLRAVQPLGHRPALLEPLVPRIDGVSLSLTLLRM